jgi:hypothetical protein
MRGLVCCGQRVDCARNNVKGKQPTSVPEATPHSWRLNSARKGDCLVIRGRGGHKLMRACGTFAAKFSRSARRHLHR